jgi:predicted RNA binding protein YcfA (HicA-like mRNA interferase family)
VPRKIRQLVKDLEKAGFEFRPRKGSHRNFVHPLIPESVVIAGQLGDDAKPYQEKDVREAQEDLRKASKTRHRP